MTVAVLHHLAASDSAKAVLEAARLCEPSRSPTRVQTGFRNSINGYWGSPDRLTRLAYAQPQSAATFLPMRELRIDAIPMVSQNLGMVCF